MKIIAFEGLSHSGKQTQLDLLAKALEAKGLRVAQSSFPSEGTPTGALIQQWFEHEWKVDQYTFELLMAADKQAQQKWFEELEKKDIDILLLKRYTLSQDAYGKADGIDAHWINMLQKHMRQPDIDILLDISAAESLTRQQIEPASQKYEKELAFMAKVRDNYIHEEQRIRSAMWLEGYVYLIDGLRSIQEVHQEILALVEKEVLTKGN